jgi:hypothetical protein
MMKLFQYVLITDGRSDKVLQPIIDWLLAQYLSDSGWTVQGVWADPNNFPKRPDRPKERLSWDIRWAIKNYPCDLLFIHRDAEKQARELRLDEIHNAVIAAREGGSQSRPFVCVIPVRMTEAWLLFDEKAIREAAGKRDGTAKLKMPALKEIENVHAKERLTELLETASEGGKRNRDKFSPREAIYLIPTYITDFSPLRKLSAFQALENELQALINAQGWNTSD